MDNDIEAKIQQETLVALQRANELLGLEVELQKIVVAREKVALDEDLAAFVANKNKKT